MIDWDEEWEGLRAKQEVENRLMAAGWHSWPAGSTPEQIQACLDARRPGEPHTLYPPERRRANDETGLA